MNSRNLMRCKDTILCSGFALAVVLAVAPAALAAFTKGRVVAPFTSKFKPGERLASRRFRSQER
jgi:hypothetical protein